jgi:hypothetical protein
LALLGTFWAALPVFFHAKPAKVPPATALTLPVPKNAPQTQTPTHKNPPLRIFLAKNGIFGKMPCFTQKHVP